MESTPRRSKRRIASPFFEHAPDAMAKRAREEAREEPATRAAPDSEEKEASSIEARVAKIVAGLRETQGWARRAASPLKNNAGWNKRS